ncbi:hypothetical protein BXY66_0376 [Shimia isoporae]|uniref:Uncharacterized protein n=1 Tax=Shimia isoporae TaxID=647720 RepID=A0A4R1NKY7_9RHOB|nr:hypothetical protein BXY66_0376 [Shimia isoporae]
MIVPCLPNSRLCHMAFQHFTLAINRAPNVAPLSADLLEHLAQVPSSVRVQGIECDRLLRIFDACIGPILLPQKTEQILNSCRWRVHVANLRNCPFRLKRHPFDKTATRSFWQSLSPHARHCHRIKRQANKVSIVRMTRSNVRLDIRRPSASPIGMLRTSGAIATRL